MPLTLEEVKSSLGSDTNVVVEAREGTTVITTAVPIKAQMITARDLGMSVSGVFRSGGVGGMIGQSSFIKFNKRFRGGGKFVCVLGALAINMVRAGLNRELSTPRGESVVSGARASPSATCCSGVYTVEGNEVENHHRCLSAGKFEGLVNPDLLAYLLPYAMFQKRTANLVGVLKGRALMWRRRQMASEACFAHYLPGTIAKALDMSMEEVWAIREIGKMPGAVLDVYQDGIDPRKLTSWWRRGGTERVLRPSWVFGSLKVGR